MSSHSISVWYLCKVCRKSFMNVNKLLDHKKLKHFKEYQRVRCILFEEITLDEDCDDEDELSEPNQHGSSCNVARKKSTSRQSLEKLRNRQFSSKTAKRRKTKTGMDTEDEDLEPGINPTKPLLTRSGVRPQIAQGQNRKSDISISPPAQDDEGGTDGGGSPVIIKQESYFDYDSQGSGSPAENSSDSDFICSLNGPSSGVTNNGDDEAPDFSLFASDSKHPQRLINNNKTHSSSDTFINGDCDSDSERTRMTTTTTSATPKKHNKDENISQEPYDDLVLIGKTERGGDVFGFEGFQYTVNKRNENNTISYQCRRVTGLNCPGRLIWYTNKPPRVSIAHQGHGPSSFEEKCDVMNFHNMLKDRSISHTWESPSEVVGACVKACPPNILSTLPKESSMRKLVCSTRRKTNTKCTFKKGKRKLENKKVTPGPGPVPGPEPGPVPVPVAGSAVVPSSSSTTTTTVLISSPSVPPILFPSPGYMPPIIPFQNSVLTTPMPPQSQTQSCLPTFQSGNS